MVYIENQLENVRQYGAVKRAACPLCAREKYRRNDKALVIFENGVMYCHRNQQHNLTLNKQNRDAANDFPLPAPKISFVKDAPTPWNIRRDPYIRTTFEFETIEGIRVQHVKFSKSDRYPRWSWRHCIHGTWYNGMGGYQPYLFNREGVESADVVFLVEGEKDAERGNTEAKQAADIITKPIAFTTTHAGASARLKPHQIEQLRGKTVYLIGDKDEAGRLGVHKKCIQFIEAGISYHTVLLPLTEEGADLSDYFDQGASFHDLLLLSDYFPPAPKPAISLVSFDGHTCNDGDGDGFTAIIGTDKTIITRWKKHKWRTCDACYAERWKRMTAQILEWQSISEEPLWMSRWSSDEWKRVRGRWRKYDKRHEIDRSFISYPQENDTIIVVHTVEKDGDELMPTDKPSIQSLMSEWGMTPKGKAVGNSRNGVGGRFQGMRGDGRPEARKQRKAQKSALHKVVKRTLADMTAPDPLAPSIVTLSAAYIKRQIAITDDDTLLVWLHQEFHAGKQRVSVLRCILDQLGVIQPEDGLNVRILGHGRKAVAEAMNCRLNFEGCGVVEIRPIDALNIIRAHASTFYPVGGNNALRSIEAMSDFSDSSSNTLKTPLSHKADILPSWLYGDWSLVKNKTNHQPPITNYKLPMPLSS